LRRQQAGRWWAALTPATLGRSLTLVRLTLRGWALAVGAAVFAITGIVIGSVDLVRIAVVVVVVLVVAVASLLPDTTAVQVRRTITNEPVHAGTTARVQVTVCGAGTAAVHEQVSAGLATQGPPQVRRSWHNDGPEPGHTGCTAADYTVVDYTVQALVRGRWPLGPVTVTRSDVFKTVQRSATLGGTDILRVWPHLVPLGTPADTGLGEPERVALGIHEPSPDDVTLREYVEGDDLRRVHWASSARSSQLMVRADEYCGLRPVTVVAAVPERQGHELEWTLSLAASVACAAFDARHTVRLLGLGGPGDPVSVQTEADGRARLLAPTLDVTCPASTQASARALAQTLAALEPAGQLVVVVLASTDPAVIHAARAALADLSAGARCWIVTRADGPVVADLRRAGCRVVVARPGDHLGQTWQQLVADL